MAAERREDPVDHRYPQDRSTKLHDTVGQPQGHQAEDQPDRDRSDDQERGEADGPGTDDIIWEA